MLDGEWEDGAQGRGELENRLVELIKENTLLEKVSDSAASGLRVRRSVYRAILQGQSDDPVSEQTATRDLLALSNRGLLVPHGERRGRFYTAGPEIIDIRKRVTGRRNKRDDTDPFADDAKGNPDQESLF